MLIYLPFTSFIDNSKFVLKMYIQYIICSFGSYLDKRELFISTFLTKYL